MFDWNDPDQAGDTIWGNFHGSEDRIVPYPKLNEENALYTFEKYNKKQKTEEVSSVVRAVEQTSGDENGVSQPNAQNNYDFNRNEELSASRLDMDIWPELPSLNAALSNGYNVQDDVESLETGLLDEPNDELSTTKLGVQLAGASELFGGGQEGKESHSFLDCDWDTIGNLDDLDRIFTNSDSLFDNDMVASADVFLSPSTDVINCAEQSILVPDIPASSEGKSSDQGGSSSQSEYHGKSQSEEKKTEVKTEQLENQNQLTTEYSGISDQSSQKVVEQKKLLKSWKKTEDRIKNKAAEYRKGSWLTNMHLPQQAAGTKFHPSPANSAQAFRSPPISQQTHVTYARPVGYPGSSDQFMSAGYGYPVYPYTAIAHLPHIHADWKKRKPVSIGQKSHLDSLKHSESVNMQPDITKTQGMTPQEKIEKLRRRHQMQAMKAIQQQRQQLGHQINGAESVVSQGGLHKNRSQEAMGGLYNGNDETPSKTTSAEIILETNELQMINDHSFAEMIYYQLQDALDKLDIRVRLQMRDSLFRLARNAAERHASDRSSSNRNDRDEGDDCTNDKTKYQDRSSRLSDAETHTNPIDRTIAHLLFHRPLASYPRTMKDGVPTSPVSSNPVPKTCRNSSGSIAEEQQWD